MNKIWIYKFTNPNWFVYIGQSTDIDRRYNQYKWYNCKDQKKLFNSFNKYGFSNHKFEIITICSLDELNNLERFFISKYKSNSNKWLNLTSWWQDYFLHNQETKIKMSVSQLWNKKTLWRKQTVDEIEKRVQKLKWKKRTEESKRKMSEARKWIVLSEETKRKMSISFQYKNSKKIICLDTLKIFGRCKDAAEYLWIKKTTLCSMLNWQNKNKTNLIYLEKYVSK